MKENNKKNYHRTIKSWPKQDRPREKLFAQGAHQLTDAELLAIILQTGTKGESAVDLARRIIQKFYSFQNMSNTDIRDWTEFKGLGKAKLAILKAALEIGRRYNSSGFSVAKKTVKTSDDIVALYQTRMKDLKNEICKIVLLDAKNAIMDTVEISKGTPAGAAPFIREIIAKVLQKFASGIIFIHNHPSGDPTPSGEDEAFTKELKEASRLMDIRFLDHIIFGMEEYYSFDRCLKEKYAK